MDKVKYVILLACIILILFYLTCPSERHLGRGFVYFEDPSSIQYWRRNDSRTIDIGPDIISYNNTWNYLLVKQKPDKYKNIFDLETHYPYGRDSVYYWFIDKRTKEIVGPITYNEMETYLNDIDLSSLIVKLQ